MSRRISGSVDDCSTSTAARRDVTARRPSGGCGGRPGRYAGLAAALRVFNRLRSELMGGQYLDLVEAARGWPSEAAIRRVLRYKSGKYTIERPLHLGHAIAGAEHAHPLAPSHSREGVSQRSSAFGAPKGIVGHQLNELRAIGFQVGQNPDQIPSPRIA